MTGRPACDLIGFRPRQESKHKMTLTEVAWFIAESINERHDGCAFEIQVRGEKVILVHRSLGTFEVTCKILRPQNDSDDGKTTILLNKEFK